MICSVYEHAYEATLVSEIAAGGDDLVIRTSGPLSLDPKTDQSHKQPRSAPAPYSTSHLLDQNCAHFPSECWVVGYRTGAQ